MEQNKYYTPTIEDFHVGFEFEHNGVSTRALEEQEWTQSVMTSKMIGAIDYDLSHYCSETIFRNMSIRVKYLDQEDIESEDWEFIQQNNTNSFTFKKDRYKLAVSFNNGGYLSIYEYEGEKVNDVYIKNKSEFRKLMKQIFWKDES